MSTNHKGKCAVKRVLLATDVVCLMTPQTASAKGCLKGAALGGVAGLSWTPKMRQVAKVEPCP